MLIDLLIKVINDYLPIIIANKPKVPTTILSPFRGGIVGGVSGHARAPFRESHKAVWPTDIIPAPSDRL